MVRKPLITIKETEIISPGYKAFDISITVIKGRWLFWNTYTSGVAFFNKGGYFTRLISNLKDNDKITYLLFSRILFSAATKIEKSINANINNVLLLSTFNQTIYQQPPVRRGFTETGGSEIRFLMVKDIQNIQKIVDYLFDSYSCICFIFDAESNQDALFSKIRDFKELDKKNILPLSLDVIKLEMECCSAEEEFTIFTRRFDKDQIRTKIMASVEMDKFEVR